MNSIRLAVFAVIMLCGRVVYGVDVTIFTFNLDASYNTSAGVYKPDGTLVRTLWRKVAYGPGSTTRRWDGKDDDGNPMPTGNYEIRVLFHNTQYVFDGMIGNTSSPSAGTSVFYGPTSIHNLAITGNSAFFANGINEGRQTMHYFNTANTHAQTDIGHKDYLIGFDQVAADDDNVYFAGRNSGFDPGWGGYYTFVTAFRTTIDPVAGVFPGVAFPFGTSLNTNLSPGNTNPADHDSYWAGVIDLDQDTWPPAALNNKAATGIAVQRNGQGLGNVLAVAHGGLNVVRLVNKVSGTLIRSFPVTNPQGLAFAPDGSLWVISGATVRNYYGPSLTSNTGAKNQNPTLGPIASANLSLPVAIAVAPNGQLIVSDAGTHQQIKAFSSTGSPLWTFGQNGGYSTNGPNVESDKFQFQVNRSNVIYHTPLAVQSDGSIWIGDGVTERLLHYSGSATGALVQLESIMYCGGNGTSTVDPHDPKRVVGDGFLEFEVNYNTNIQLGWTLKKNWAAGLPAQYFNDTSGKQGLRNLITFKAGQPYGLTTGNGRTYALLGNFTGDGYREIVELPASGPLRLTGTPILRRDRYPGFFGSDDVSLESDGSLRYHQVVGNTVYWTECPLQGFGENGTPCGKWPKEQISLKPRRRTTIQLPAQEISFRLDTQKRRPTF